MCDRFVALGNSTESGSVLLAKSADTEVNEAEKVIHYPRRGYGEGALVRMTHRTLPGHSEFDYQTGVTKKPEVSTP